MVELPSALPFSSFAKSPHAGQQPHLLRCDLPGQAPVPPPPAPGRRQLTERARVDAQPAPQPRDASDAAGRSTPEAMPDRMIKPEAAEARQLGQVDVALRLPASWACKP